MRKVRQMLQSGLLLVMIQIILLLLSNPLATRLTFNEPTLFFLLALVISSLLYFRYFSRELREFKVELLETDYGRLLRFSYLMMIVINAVGAYALILEQAVVGNANQEMMLGLFVHSSLFLLGIDLIVFLPVAQRFFLRKFLSDKRAYAGVLFSVLLFAFLRNPLDLSCFVVYTGLGALFCHLVYQQPLRFELSIFSHLLRNSLSFIFLLIFW